MSRNFFDPQEPYAQLRRAFVYKDRPTHTPPHLLGHPTVCMPGTGPSKAHSMA